MAVKGKSRILGVIVVLLLLCETASLAVLFSHISKYSEKEFTNIIPLTESKGNTVVTVVQNSKDTLSVPVAENTGIVRLSNPSFSAYDEKTVWQAETDVEIFRISYENDENRITVKDSNGSDDKLIAPGTSNKYVFTLANTGDVPLEYNLNMESWITGTELNIPVRVRVSDHENNYLSGSSDASVPVMDLNNVDKDGLLGTGRYAVYTLEWEWPFEQNNDEFDTMLGNFAADNEIALSIRINTTASYSEKTEAGDSGILPPQTGDSFNIRLYSVIIFSALLIIFVSFFISDKRTNTEEET